MRTWIFCFIFSPSERFSRSATWRNLLRRFLTNQTADRHRFIASGEGCLGSTSKSFNKFIVAKDQ